MKKIAGLALLGWVLLSPSAIQAQTYTEQALLFSRITPGGSARIQAMGGAQVSIGGDYSSAVSNPAGLGMFNRSEYAFTPGMNFNSTNSSYLGNNTVGSKSQFEVPSFSAAFHNDYNGSSGFLGGTFGITFNRLNDFNKTFTYGGTNSNSSIIDSFILDANGLTSTDLSPGGSYSNTPTAMGFNNYLFDNTSATQYASPMDIDPSNPKDIRHVDQTETVKTTGAQNQISLAYGVNYSDKIFFGGGVGFTTINYSETKSYSESNYKFDLDPSYNPLTRMDLTETLSTSGSGINLSLGMIARPVDNVQLGVSYNSPTWYYTVADSYQGSMTGQWNNFDYYGDHSVVLNNTSDQTDQVISNYALRTPSRLNVGGTFFAGKSGFISADVEFVNYAGALYTSHDTGVDYNYDNDKIKASYQSAVNYRGGGEYRYKSFRARAGYAYMSDPYKTLQNGTAASINRISAGLGFRTPTFYMDVALIMSQSNSTYRPYDVQTAESPLVITSNKNSMFMVTFGFPVVKK